MFLLFRKRSFYTVIIIALLLVTGGCYLVIQNQTAAPTISWMIAEKTFLIDPGHGGTFPGRVNDDVLEKDINLNIALKLDQLLEETGAQVVMTRRSDVDLIPAESKEDKLLL
ncbi:MAG: N-acetylmuramoyl-L-alanine amidase, partial [Peptococcaceae bacterium]|nr:N-acetylmuramoyl-L-alanine amidase [Peptococcaceae bacterium]